MAVTANRSYPYPVAGDPPAGHTQIQALANAVDVDMQNVDRFMSGVMTGDISVTSSTVLVNATGLTVTLAANSRFTFTCNCYYQAASASRFKWGYTGPAGMVTIYGGIGLDVAATTTTGVSNVGIHTASGTRSFGGTAANALAVVTGAIGTTTGGTFQVQFAQETSGATATILRANSSLIVRRLN